ncbi:hypothetical protein BKA65DRAFT_105663 [Rhexocercosporidium sp. MPI-PUGE-AT-0058]|nr:hypothetical protein BKA65DRAFT_105663 [Rhexocercosporidium sp. MPI-PUGE-AT-0058]
MSDSPPASPPQPQPTTLPPTNPAPLTPCERSSLMHWSLYGQGHDPSVQETKPRTAPPKNPKKMSIPIFSAWNVPLSAEQMGKLRRGFQPEMMEDKWLVYAVDGGEDEAGDSILDDESVGKIESERKRKEADVSKLVSLKGSDTMRVFMVRSWTGKPVFEIQILVLRSEGSKKGDSGGQGEIETGFEGRIEGIVWESDEKVITGQDEAVAKERAREVCRWILGVHLLPDVPKPRRGGGGERESVRVE